jgi:hypothetical protein
MDPQAGRTFIKKIRGYLSSYLPGSVGPFTHAETAFLVGNELAAPKPRVTVIGLDIRTDTSKHGKMSSRSVSIRYAAQSQLFDSEFCAQILRRALQRYPKNCSGQTVPGGTGVRGTGQAQAAYSALSW